MATSSRMVFPCVSGGKEYTCIVGDLDLIPGLGRSHREAKGYPLQYSGLENSLDCVGWRERLIVGKIGTCFNGRGRAQSLIQFYADGWSCITSLFFQFSSLQFIGSVMSDFAIPWTATHQDSLSITASWSLLKLMSIESVISSNHLILCHPFLLLPSIFPNIRVLSNEPIFKSCDQSIGVSASASVFPMNICYWFPLGWNGWISVLSKGIWSAFSNTTVQNYQFFSTQLSLSSKSHIHAWLLEKP